jgi:hypothetical protein
MLRLNAEFMISLSYMLETSSSQSVLNTGSRDISLGFKCHIIARSKKSFGKGKKLFSLLL